MRDLGASGMRRCHETPILTRAHCTSTTITLYCFITMLFARTWFPKVTIRIRCILQKEVHAPHVTKSIFTMQSQATYIWCISHKWLCISSYWLTQQGKVNGNKFHLIIFNSQMTQNAWSINADDYVIRNKPVVKLFGFYIDDLLFFYSHVGNVCSKIGRKLNVFRRLSGVLNDKCNYFYFILLYCHILIIMQPFGTSAVGIKCVKMNKLQRTAPVICVF